jgi:hypothetical protein
MEKFFVMCVAGQPRKFGIFSNKKNGGCKLHSLYNSKDDAENECEEWNWLENETDSRVLQAMGWA